MTAAPLPTKWPAAFNPDDPDALVHGVVVDERGDARSSAGQHRHRSGQLTIAVSGWVGVAAEGRVLALPAGTAAWVPAGVWHLGMLGEGAVSWYVHFAEPLFPKLPRRVERFYLSALALEAARRFLDLAPPFALDLPMRRIAGVLIDEIAAAKRLPEHFGTLSAHPVVRATAERVLSRPDMRVSREDYAAQAGISGRQLARIISAETGRSFADWRLELVMLHAAQMLRRGATIETAAEAVGYASASAFIVAFKRVFGMTPGAYAADPGMTKRG